MRPPRLSLVGAIAIMAGCAFPLRHLPSKAIIVSASERARIIVRAQVWRPTEIASMDVRVGPRRNHGFAPGETVECSFTPIVFGGHTPKFGCVTDDGERARVRFGQDNGEVYAGVAATRLLWMLGFGAETMYPVHIVCQGCPATFGEPRDGAVAIDVAAIERGFGGSDIAGSDDERGWEWTELDRVNERAGGAPSAQRDALKLLAVFLQHTDSKAEQQRLLCLDEEPAREHGRCEHPFMMIHDVGQTFGRANLMNRASVGSVNLAAWARTPIWADRANCVGSLAQSQTGTLHNPVITEAGRRFLADLLGQLTDQQIEALFVVARFADKPSGGGAPERWAEAFRQKREEIASARCP